ARAEHVRRADVDEAALAEVQAAAVERADVRAQLLDVREPRDAVHEVGALGEPGRVVRVEVEVTAHARRRVDHDVDAAVADPADHLAVELHVAGALAAAGVAHVHVHDGRARAGGGDAGVGDLLGRHGHVFGLADRVTGAGQRTRDDDLAIHRATLSGTSNQSTAGEADSSRLVYSSLGVSSTSTTNPDSTSAPALSTCTRAAMERTSARLWVTKSMLICRVLRRFSSSATIEPCTETSSAEVISSHTSRSGSAASARAMATRWRSPPERRLVCRSSTVGPSGPASPCPAGGPRTSARPSTAGAGRRRSARSWSCRCPTRRPARPPRLW